MTRATQQAPIDTQVLMASLGFRLPGLEHTVASVIDLYCQFELPTFCERHQLEVMRLLGDFKAVHGAKPVYSCKPMDLKLWLINPDWKSDWTRRRVVAILKRPFSWAVQNQELFMNPFLPVKGFKGAGRRPMTDAEFRKALRHSSPALRRMLLALRLTGARPGELRTLRWDDIHFDQSFALLKEHKTAKKTGRPRTIMLPAVLMRLIGWLRKSERPSPPTTTARRLIQALSKSPRRAKEVNNELKRLGITDRMLFRARNRLGVKVENIILRDRRVPVFIRKQIGKKKFPFLMWKDPETGNIMTASTRTRDPERLVASQRRKSRKVTAQLRRLVKEGKPVKFTWRCYVPPKKWPQLPAEPAEACDNVFPNDIGLPWDHESLSHAFIRVRKSANLPADCYLYGLRHAFAVRALMNDVSIKAVSLLLGHGDVSTTEHYLTALGGRTDFLADALEKANLPQVI